MFPTRERLDSNRELITCGVEVRLASTLGQEPGEVGAPAGSLLSSHTVLPHEVFLSVRWGREHGRAEPLYEAPRVALVPRGGEHDHRLSAGCELSDVATVGDGKHLRFRLRDGARLLGTAIAFGLGSQLDRFRRVGRYDVAFRLQENRWNGTVAPQLVVRRVFDTPDRYLELRERFAGEWRTKQLSADGEAIFEELGYDQGVGWRSLLESERFRGLLEREPLARAA